MPAVTSLVYRVEDLENAAYALKKSVDLCEDSAHKTDWMKGDQSRAKWGNEEAPTSFGSTYQEFLAQLHRKIDQWASDVAMAGKRIQQTQESLQGASAGEVARINQMLVDQWYAESAPAPVSGTAPSSGTATPAQAQGLGFGVPQPGSK